jgi:hypothetical protein
LEYLQASYAKDKDEQIRLIRLADERMVASLERIKQLKLDYRANITVAQKAIQAKMKLEDYNLLDRGMFAGDLTTPPGGAKDKILVAKELNRTDNIVKAFSEKEDQEDMPKKPDEELPVGPDVLGPDEAVQTPSKSMGMIPDTEVDTFDLPSIVKVVQDPRTGELVMPLKPEYFPMDPKWLAKYRNAGVFDMVKRYNKMLTEFYKNREALETGPPSEKPAKKWAVTNAKTALFNQFNEIATASKSVADTSGTTRDRSFALKQELDRSKDEYDQALMAFQNNPSKVNKVKLDRAFDYMRQKTVEYGSIMHGKSGEGILESGLSNITQEVYKRIQQLESNIIDVDSTANTDIHETYSSRINRAGLQSFGGNRMAYYQNRLSILKKLHQERGLKLPKEIDTGAELGEAFNRADFPGIKRFSDFDEVYPTDGDTEQRKIFDRIQQLENNVIDVDRTANTDMSDDYTKRLKQNGLYQFGGDKMEYYKNRLAILEQLHKQRGINVPLVPEDDKDDEGATADIVLPTEGQTGFTQGEIEEQKAEHFERTSEVIGGEALVLNSTKREQVEEQERFDRYSYIPEGFGEGNRKQNSMFREQLRAYDHRFRPLQPPKRSHVPFSEPGRKPRQQPTFIPVYQIDNHFDNEHDNTVFPVFKTRADYTNSVNDRDWENSNNINYPEAALMKFKAKPAHIPQHRFGQRSDGQRFASYQRTSHEADIPTGSKYHPRYEGSVPSDRIIYDNCRGFPVNRNLSSWQYEMARAKK